MSIRTFSQNTITLKRLNATNKIYAKYWSSNVSGASLNLQGLGSGASKHIAKDSTGAVYIVGSTSLGTGNTDAFLIKYDTSGSLVWQKALGQSASADHGQSIVINSSDIIYITGTTTGGNAPFVAKYDTSGNLLAQIKLTPASSATYVPNCIDVYNATGDVFIAGWHVTSGGVYYGFVMRFDSNLSLISNVIKGSLVYYGILVDQSTGNFYTCGGRSPNGDVCVTKFSSADMSATWTYEYNQPYGAYGIVMDSSGYIYVVLGSSIVALVKIDSSGNVIWSRTLTGVTNTSGNSIAIDSSNNIIISSYHYVTPYENYIVKYDSGGNLLWQRSLDSSGTDYIVGLVCDSLNNIYVLIWNSTSFKCTTFRLPGDGSLTGTYTNGDSYTYATISSFTSSVSPAYNPISFSSSVNNPTTTAVTNLLTSQTVSHTVSLLAIAG